MKYTRVKIKVPTIEISKKVQEVLFQQGHTWPRGRVYHRCTEKEPRLGAIYTENDGTLGYIPITDMEYFEKRSPTYTEVHWQELLPREPDKDGNYW